jgi:hypothetical protein
MPSASARGFEEDAIRRIASAAGRTLPLAQPDARSVEPAFASVDGGAAWVALARFALRIEAGSIRRRCARDCGASASSAEVGMVLRIAHQLKASAGCGALR